MAKKRAPQKLATIVASVAQNVSLPARTAKVPEASVGAQPTNAVTRESPLRSNARYAGVHSDLFPKGGEAFERWCAAQGISPRERRTTEDWSALLAEFASRTIHGLRRGPGGGTHQADKRSRR